MMWLNPSGRIGADEHFDQLLFDEKSTGLATHDGTSAKDLLLQHLQNVDKINFYKTGRDGSI